MTSLYRQLYSKMGPDQFNYHYHISLKHRYLYVEVSKAACSYIKRMLVDAEFEGEGLDEQHQRVRKNVHGYALAGFIRPFQLGAEQFDQLIGNNEITVFTAVRNPFSRCLSGYLDKILRGEPMFNDVRGAIARARGVSADRVEPTSVKFIEFCRALATKKTFSEFEQHWRPQYMHLSADIVHYDRILRFENLNDEFRNFCSEVNIPHLNDPWVAGNATNANAKLKSYYDKECIDIVRHVYKDDFLNFNFSTELR